LQDIVIDETFEKLQKEFFEKNCVVFEDVEENKMEYMTIFKSYQRIIETYIEQQLKAALPNADFKKFSKLLETRSDQIDTQLLDMLLSFTDFTLFKEMMLSYKKSLEAKKPKPKPKKETNVKEEVKANKENKNTKGPNTTTAKTSIKSEKSEKIPMNKQASIDSAFGELVISGKATVIHTDYDSEGEERPDLQLDIIPLPTPKKVSSKANPKPEPVTKK